MFRQLAMVAAGLLALLGPQEAAAAAKKIVRTSKGVTMGCSAKTRKCRLRNTKKSWMRCEYRLSFRITGGAIKKSRLTVTLRPLEGKTVEYYYNVLKEVKGFMSASLSCNPTKAKKLLTSASKGVTMTCTAGVRSCTFLNRKPRHRSCFATLSFVLADGTRRRKSFFNVKLRPAQRVTKAFHGAAGRVVGFTGGRLSCEAKR